MAYNFSPFKQKVATIEDWLKRELSQIRTGRAAPALLDSILVPAYGSKMPINQVANMNIEGPRTIRIAPWDSSVNKSIEKAIIDSNLGVSVATDDKGLRVNFPELTAERRAMLAKLVREKMEGARVSLRSEREEILTEFKRQEKDGTMSEDDLYRHREELQKLVDDANRMFDEVITKKEEELQS